MKRACRSVPSTLHCPEGVWGGRWYDVRRGFLENPDVHTLPACIGLDLIGARQLNDPKCRVIKLYQEQRENADNKWGIFRVVQEIAISCIIKKQNNMFKEVLPEITLLQGVRGRKPFRIVIFTNSKSSNNGQEQHQPVRRCGQTRDICAKLKPYLNKRSWRYTWRMCILSVCHWVIPRKRITIHAVWPVRE